MNEAEALVAKICRQSFLSLWSFANPRNSRGKELCDVLVVCDPHVILISVKHCVIRQSGDDDLDVSRWIAKAIDASVKQLYGATRDLNTLKTVIDSAGEATLALPPLGQRLVHRVAIALGGDERTWIASGDHGQGHVHVYDEDALFLVLQELDTITDFTRYLHAIESLNARTRVVVEGGEEDLMAYYIRNGRRFPDGYDTIHITGDTWDDLRESRAWFARKAADRVSYLWDEIIETFSSFLAAGSLEGDNQLNQVEPGLRYMARERRFSRRVLASAMRDFLADAARGSVMARLIPPGPDVAYVFLAAPRRIPREVRTHELALRCAWTRARFPEAAAVVGLSTEAPDDDPTVSWDLACISVPATSPSLGPMLEEARRTKVFSRMVNTPISHQEFPSTGSGTGLTDEDVPAPPMNRAQRRAAKRNRRHKQSS